MGRTVDQEVVEKLAGVPMYYRTHKLGCHSNEILHVVTTQYWTFLGGRKMSRENPEVHTYYSMQDR